MNVHSESRRNTRSSMRRAELTGRAAAFAAYLESVIANAGLRGTVTVIREHARQSHFSLTTIRVECDARGTVTEYRRVSEFYLSTEGLNVPLAQTGYAQCIVIQMEDVAADATRVGSVTSI